jgi:hypothetical protein
MCASLHYINKHVITKGTAYTTEYSLPDTDLRTVNVHLTESLNGSMEGKAPFLVQCSDAERFERLYFCAMGLAN